MIQDISITIKPQDENDKVFIENKCFEALKQKRIPIRGQKIEFEFIKKSIDARHGQVKLCMRFRAYIGEENPAAANKKIEWKKADGKNSVVIVGAGPAGLFAALRFLEYGIKPVIIERGKTTSERKRDIAAISTKGIVGENSNYCFGEGGAGTFSDGKLYTRSNKRGGISRILKILNIFGASEKILTDAHPHIGTDRLPAIINAMREKIIECGGEIHFGHKCTGFKIESADNGKFIKGITASDSESGMEKEFYGDAVFLATGHSASDIYRLVAETVPEALEAKTFAAGVRVEHPRKLIDSIQYHGKENHMELPTAEYRLTAQSDGRGVYSFCMCPGGFVVPSASAPEQIVVNGMSAAKRNSKWSNAAIVVEIRPEDIPEEFVKQAELAGTKATAGLFFRDWLEHETFLHGNGQAAPAQRLTDFLNGKKSMSLPVSSYTPGLVSSRLDQWLPPHISDRLKDGFHQFNRLMKGFITDEAVLIASETRTSTPVRILRNRDTFENEQVHGLYPVGEGSGWSGGIVSSAMDGENAAESAAKKLLG